MNDIARSTGSHGKLRSQRKKRKQRSTATRRERMLTDLKRSGLTAKDAERMSWKPISGAKAKRLLKLSKVNLPDGYIIPYFDPDGEPIDGAFRWRALDKYTQRNRHTGIHEPGPKYRQAARTEPWLYLCPLIDWLDIDGSIVVTEGEKKAASACKQGIPAVGLGGVWNWKVPKSNDKLLPILDHILFESNGVEICFDSDLDSNFNVRLALVRLCAALADDGCNVQVVYLPSGADGEKVGLDDFLVDAGRRPNGKFSRRRARRAFEELTRHDPPVIEPVTMQCMADIPTEPLLPIWSGIIYRRKVALFPGDPGVGKSLLSCDIAARVTRGADWPGGEPAIIDPSNVIILSGEDDAGDTIKPRCIAAGADVSKVFIIKDVVETQGGEVSALSLDKHIKYIHEKVLSVKAKLLIIDPISAFEGDRDSNKNSIIRALINKLRQYAIEGDYAVLVITHFNKPGEKLTAAAIHRVMGSMGLVAACRTSHAFVRDPEDREHLMLLPIKVNLGPDIGGFGCRIALDHKQNLRPPPPYLKWDDELIKDQNIDDVLAQPSPREQAQKIKEQKVLEWLDGVLMPGEKMLSTEFNEKFERLGYSAKMVRKNMPKLGYTKKQIGFKGPWWTRRERRQLNQSAGR